MTSEQIQNLLEDMSLQEKIGQLLQLTGIFYAQEGMATGPMSEMGLTREQVDMAGIEGDMPLWIHCLERRNPEADCPCPFLTMWDRFPCTTAS